jgi:hypothetical protein
MAFFHPLYLKIISCGRALHKKVTAHSKKLSARLDADDSVSRTNKKAVAETAQPMGEFISADPA